MTQREAIHQSPRYDAQTAGGSADPADVSADTLPDARAPSRRRRIAKAASQLWQAGIGAAITLQHRGAKSFHHLAEKGARFQSRRQRRQQAEADSEAVAVAQHSLREAASERMHSIEHSIENSLDRGRDNTLHWIGVPSRKDFEALSAQLESLTRTVAALQRQLQGEGTAERPVKRAARPRSG